MRPAAGAARIATVRFPLHDSAERQAGAEVAARGVFPPAGAAFGALRAHLPLQHERRVVDVVVRRVLLGPHHSPRRHEHRDRARALP
jgi:hypothetical protein